MNFTCNRPRPSTKSGELLIAAARDSLPLRGVTQQRRGIKHQTSPRSRPPASEPDAAPPSTVRPKKKGPRRGQPQQDADPPYDADRLRSRYDELGPRSWGLPRL